jgi:hypothetical protein
LQSRAEFRVADAACTLPFADRTFDVSSATMPSTTSRTASVLSEWSVSPGGRCLYTIRCGDGCLSNAEIDAQLDRLFCYRWS